MPNQPTFTNAKQLKSNVAMGLSHIEVQEAYSPIKHLSLTAGIFAGSKNQTSIEYGIGGYTKLFRDRDIYLSANYLQSNGWINTKFISDNIIEYRTHYDVRCNYTGRHFQYAIYAKHTSKKPFTYGLLIKHSAINYKELYYSAKVEYQQDRFLDFRITDRRNIRFNSFSVLFFIEKKLTSLSYVLIQAGAVPGSMPGRQIDDYPIKQKLFWLERYPALNIAFGIKID